MILLKTLLEAITNSKKGTMTLVFRNNPPQKYRCLLSPNTIPRELPYRLTWFGPDMAPLEHYDMDKAEYEIMMKNNAAPRLLHHLLHHLNSTIGNVETVKIDFN